LFPVVLIAQPTGYAPCQGYAWTGQTQTPSVEGVVRVTCPYHDRVMTLTATRWISDTPGVGPDIALHRESCMWSLSCLSNVSTPGTHRPPLLRQRLRHGRDTHPADGLGNACIWT
jgi:hypothetical protein